MTRIVISAETETHTTRRADPTDRWDYGDSSGHVSNVIAYVETRENHYYGESACVDLPVGVGGTVYAVVADYESGSTGGRSGGQAQVVDAFTTLAEAEALIEVAGAEDDDSRYGFTHNGREYSRSWVGHFERLQELVIWVVTVREHPADPFRPKGSSGQYSIRYGH